MGARTHRAVEEVAADMRILRQRIGAGEHEQRSIEHVVEIEDPRRRGVKQIALDHLDAHDRHQHKDQPGRGLAKKGADAVDRVQKPLCRHAHFSVMAGLSPAMTSKSPDYALIPATCRSDQNNA